MRHFLFTHRFFYHETGVAGNRFPILEQGNACATRVEYTENTLKVKVTDEAENILLERTL